MKHTILFLSTLFFLGAAFSQSATAKFQGRIKPGSVPNSVIVAIRSNETFTGNVSNFQFTIQTPADQPQVNADIKANPFSAYLPTAGYSRENSIELGYKNFLFGGTTVGSPNYTFTSGVEVDILEVTFSDGPATPMYPIRLAQLPNGGATTQKNFYIEINGIDNTNQTAMFYGSSVSNDAAGYSAYSYSALTNIALPVSWLNFNAVRNINDVRVTWDVANEINVDRYELEVSTNGTDFVKFATVPKSANNNSSYSQLDVQVARYSAKQLHYRIKQVDKDGKFSYSPTKTVRLDVKGETALYPNPAKDGFTLTIPYLNANQKRIQLQLVNGLGQVVERKDITRLAAANYYFSLNSNLVTSGEYMLKIFEDGELMETKKVSVKR